MAIEIEKKYRIDEETSARLAARLGELGAEFRYETFEENLLHRGGVLDDRAAVLRIRKAGESSTLTYKEGAEGPGEFKQRVEFETAVSDVAAAENIVERLGYRLSLVYEKRRRAWSLSGTEVVLDELPFGFYMEIEGDIDRIRAAEKVLGADRLETETRSYPRLAEMYGEDVDGVREARFEPRNRLR